MKSIILEGPNASGKSTLAEKLRVDFTLPYSHSGPNPGDTQQALDACSQQLERLRNGYIVDRVTPISRPIYDHDRIPELELILFNRRLEEMLEYAVIIYACGDGVHEPKSYYPSGHLKKITEEKQLIRDLYSEYMQGVDHINFDWRKDSYEKLVEKINEKLCRI